MEEIITKKKWWMGKVAYQIWPKSFLMEMEMELVIFTE